MSSFQPTLTLSHVKKIHHMCQLSFKWGSVGGKFLIILDFRISTYICLNSTSRYSQSLSLVLQISLVPILQTGLEQDCAAGLKNTSDWLYYDEIIQLFWFCKVLFLCCSTWCVLFFLFPLLGHTNDKGVVQAGRHILHTQSLSLLSDNHVRISKQQQRFLPLK